MHRMVCSSPLNDALIGTGCRKAWKIRRSGMLAAGQTWRCGNGQKGEGKGLLASVELEGEENGCSLSFSWFVIACFT